MLLTLAGVGKVTTNIQQLALVEEVLKKFEGKSR